MGDFITGNFNLGASQQIAAGGCIGRGEGPSTSRTADGKVQFENDNYRITADDNNEVMIHNKATGETYRIWGDPHVEIDGKHAFDFWGQTTFVLDDGTRLTIATTPWDEGNNGATVASQLTIVDGGGDYVAHIEGIDSNARGDLSFTDVRVGQSDTLNVFVDEGNVLRENANGSGFVAVGADGKLRGVDQAFINATDQVKQQGAQFAKLMGSILTEFSGIVSLAFVGTLLAVDIDVGQEPPQVEATPLPLFGNQFNFNLAIGRG